MQGISDDTTPRDRYPAGKNTATHLIHRGELQRVALAFSAFFLILCSYYILRPVRDTMAVQFGAANIHWLFSATFAVTLLVVPAFGWVVKRAPRALVLPLVYGFVIASLLAFHLVFMAGAALAGAAAFFIWLSVFNLFVISLFWTALSDSFTTDQAHRLYGYIAAGGTAGALAGPAATAVLARHVSTAFLLLIACALLASALVCMTVLRRNGDASTSSAPSRPVGGSVIAGIPLMLKLRNLRGIALIVICYTTVSTVLYIELVDLVGKRYASPAERTAFFAMLDLAVNGTALMLQVLGTGRIVQRFGLRAALSIVPLLVMAALAAIAGWRSALTLGFVQALHRAGEYALNKPGREMIYTTVDPESRYKAKNVIDTAVYRASDACSAWLVAAMRATGLDTLMLAAIPAAAAWLIMGFRIGRRHDRNEST